MGGRKPMGAGAVALSMTWRPRARVALQQSLPLHWV
jgi:hypothetical protein